MCIRDRHISKRRCIFGDEGDIFQGFEGSRPTPTEGMEWAPGDEAGSYELIGSTPEAANPRRHPPRRDFCDIEPVADPEADWTAVLIARAFLSREGYLQPGHEGYMNAALDGDDTRNATAANGVSIYDPSPAGPSPQAAADAKDEEDSESGTGAPKYRCTNCGHRYGLYPDKGLSAINSCCESPFLPWLPENDTIWHLNVKRERETPWSKKRTVSKETQWLKKRHSSRNCRRKEQRSEFFGLYFMIQSSS